MASDELRLVSQLFGSAREMSDRQSKKRRWFSYKSRASHSWKKYPALLTAEGQQPFRLYQLLSQQIRTRFGQLHEARLLFIRQWKMYVAQVQAQNKHSPS